MRKVMTFTFLLCLTAALTLTADLVDIYKRGEVKLVADPEFGKDTDWQKLFDDYAAISQTGKHIGGLREMAIAPDGSIYISNYTKYNIFKFDRNGNFIKEFGKKGRKSGEFLWRPNLSSILDDRYVVVRIYHGSIMLFDLEGNFVKSIPIDYPLLNCVALKDNKIAVMGNVPWKGSRSKNLIAIKDVATEMETELSFYMRDYFGGGRFAITTTTEGKAEDKAPAGIGIKDRTGGGRVHLLDRKAGTATTYFIPPFSEAERHIRRLPDGNLVVGYADRKEITIYSPEGEIIKVFELAIEPLKFTEKAKEEFRKGTLQSIPQSIKVIKEQTQKTEVDENSYKSQVEGFLSKPDFFPENLPYYYNLLVDSDGNILVFPYTEENGKYKFHVYSPEGEYLCTSAIDPGEFKITVNARLNNLVFFGGNLYALVAAGEGQAGPFRLIKVRLAG